MPQKMVFLDPRTGNELLIDNTLRAIKHYHD